MTLTGQKHLKLMYLGHLNYLSLVYIWPILPLEASKTAKTVFSLYDEPIIESNCSKVERPKKRFSLIKRPKMALNWKFHGDIKLYVLRFVWKNPGTNAELQVYFFGLGPILGPILAKFPKVESQKTRFLTIKRPTMAKYWKFCGGMKLYALRFWCKNLGANAGLEMYFYFSLP